MTHIMTDAEFKAFRAAVKASSKARKEVVRLRPALVPIRITHHPDQPDERRYTAVMEAPIFLDDPSCMDERCSIRRDFCTAPVSIPWLHDKVRTAIRRYELGKNVQQDDAVTAKAQTQAYCATIARYMKQDLAWPFGPVDTPPGERVQRNAPFKKLAAQTTGITRWRVYQRIESKTVSKAGVPMTRIAKWRDAPELVDAVNALQRRLSPDRRK
jgi:hypothetical protein